MKLLLTIDDVARYYRVPYWLIDRTRPEPSWIRRPIWRLRALIWSLT